MTLKISAALVLFSSLAAAQPSARTIPLTSAEGLQLKNATAEAVTYRGRTAVRLAGRPDGDAIAIVRGLEFRNGVIEVDLAGKPAAGAFDAARGFIGIAFRVQPGGEKLECVYLRPTNGRADDQLRRNHSTQYVSHPDYPWFRLRKESPGVYESYVDLEPGAWTQYKLEVQGARARLYVQGASQPVLIVNDLKLGETAGGIALWMGPGTEGHFSNLRILPR